MTKNSNAKRKKKYSQQKKMVMIMAATLLSVGFGGILYWSTHYSNPENFADYQIHGIDISRHQGDIIWKNFDKQQYQFIFIKATEGGDYQDPKFQENWLNAHELDLYVGAYHFFRNCKTGEEQANNYINTVPKRQNSLPPVMDLEFQWSCPEVSAEQLQQRIAVMAKNLQQHYGKKPIFYTTPNYYKTYLQGHFDDHVLWLQDMKNSPPLLDKRPWLFWQYSNQGKVAGIQGNVDLNVFRGNDEDLKLLIQQQP